MLDASFNQFGPDGLNSTIAVASNLKILDLSDNSIQSTIPTELGSLTNLVSIGLANNFLSGSVPSELWALTMLQSLNLDNNIFNGTDLFPGVFALSSLRQLRLSGCLVSTSVPTQIGSMPSMESLWLDGMDLSGLLPTEVGALTALTDFKITGNLLSGEIPSEIGSLSNLTSFEVGLNNFTGTVPTEVFSLSQLRTLDVSSNELSGSIPSDVGILSRMSTFNIHDTGFSGTIPSEFGLLTDLRRVQLSTSFLNQISPTDLPFVFNDTTAFFEPIPGVTANNRFSGTIPSEVGLMTSLEQLDLSLNPLNGSIPTEMGMLTALTSLQLNSNSLTGGLPTEIGLARDLETLFVSGNEGLRGTIPSELGLLSDLSLVILNGNQLVSSLPSELGRLSQLSFLFASDNLITGSLPSELGQLDFIVSAYLDTNLLSGPIPSELEMASALLNFDISDTGITGSIPQGMCTRVQDLFGDYYTGFGLGLTFVVDCDNVACSCCGCPTEMPSISPSASLFPTRAPSTSSPPSISPEPTTNPSVSLEPSVSLSPTQGLACSNFTSIAFTGSLLGISGLDDEAEVVDLPFSFLWRGAVNFTAVTVTTNGDIFLGNAMPNIDVTAFDPIPIEKNGRYTSIPRIAVAQGDIGPSGSIVTAQLEDSFVISWENVFHFCYPTGQPLSFQALLFENGKVELRWGEGRHASFGMNFAAGLEDDPVDVIVPATGEPFDAFGLGVSSQWPRNQCRAFVVSDDDGYLEIIS